MTVTRPAAALAAEAPQPPQEPPRCESCGAFINLLTFNCRCFD